jgi:ribosome-binding factor A
MLAGKRAVRVGDQILKEIADLLMRKVKDPRVNSVTLTGINLTDDLKHGKIFFSVIGESEDIQKTQSGLDSAKGFIRREVAHRLNLRYMPDLMFQYDPSIEVGNHMERLFQKIHKNESIEQDE